MIVRARPRYLDPAWLDGVPREWPGPKPDGWFLDRGRSALWVLLYALRLTRGNKRPVVALQSFNCPVVIEAVLQSGCTPMLVDIKAEDLSMSLESLRQAPVRPDVVIVTHYQGLPNTEYFEFREYCDRVGALMVEDNSQTFGAKVDGVTVGSLGDALFESYAFDKPFSCWTGGYLEIKRSLDSEWTEKVRGLIRELESECERTERGDVRALRYLFENTSESRYRPGVNDWEWVRAAHSWPWSENYGARLAEFEPARFVYKVLRRCIRRKTRIVPRRLGAIKVSLVLLQKRHYRYDPEPAQVIEEVARRRGLRPLGRAGVSPHWNRYSLLDPDGSFAPWLQARGIEAGNHNWPAALHRLYPRRSLIVPVSLPVTEMAARCVVNIPLWPGARRLQEVLET